MSINLLCRLQLTWSVVSGLKKLEILDQIKRLYSLLYDLLARVRTVSLVW
jgi:hypothetical protein